MLDWSSLSAYVMFSQNRPSRKIPTIGECKSAVWMINEDAVFPILIMLNVDNSIFEGVTSVRLAM
jgi:hypothetical protein